MKISLYLAVVGLVSDLMWKQNKTFEFEFPEIVTSTPVALKVYVATISSEPTSMAISC